MNLFCEPVLNDCRAHHKLEQDDKAKTSLRNRVMGVDNILDERVCFTEAEA